ncbi:Cof-type HAD-IIB family hydrolase [Catenibacterium mitsuokai]|uniref:Cof-type HAD-IIB family hydrolase n=1 Tax=Catenibacterium mitsuokai TaxID=100886 RepID=UPI003F8A0B95
MKTLYVTDLDGTLLEPDKSIKPDNLKLINQLIDEDVNITYATARSLITAKQVIGDINFKLPVIVQNGTFILSPKGDMILGNYLGDSILDTVKDYDISPIVYSQIGKKTYFSYVKDKMSAGVKAFVDDHLDDPRNHPVNTYEDLYEGDIFYLLLIDDYDKLKPLYDLFKEDYYAVFDQEMYSHDWWLEIMSPDASKANAIKYLKQKLQCDEVVVFGDGKNDIEMFEEADYSCAVENAAPELIKCADEVIHISVPQYINQREKLKCFLNTHNQQATLLEKCEAEIVRIILSAHN